MLMLTQAVAVLACFLFTGAAVYITLVEHPARMSCPTGVAFTQWLPSYRRATIMQASLALIGGVAATFAWLQVGSLSWLVGGILIFAVVPTTLLFIRPITTRLEASTTTPDTATTRALLVRWGHLHAVRSAMSVAASLVFLSVIL